jgi:hypothetical protein
MFEKPSFVVMRKTLSHSSKVLELDLWLKTPNNALAFHG